MHVAGSGRPLVLIPGVQGRWEWMAPTVEALSRHFRVATFSLCGEPGAPPMQGGLEAEMQQVDAALRLLDTDRAVVVGVSYGGWVAVRYAAAHPERVSALVLASAPGPGFVLSPRYQRWVAAPRRSFPVFVATAPSRVMPELRRVFPTWRARTAFALRQGWRVLRAPMSGVRAAQRVRRAMLDGIEAAAASVRCPTLLVTGEDALDQIVPAASTRRYAEIIGDAETVTLEGTGHMGTVTRAGDFAAIVEEFVRRRHEQRSGSDT